MKIFIAGGTSGIGLELALQYQKLGHEVAICGRDITRLKIEYVSIFQSYEIDICDKLLLQTSVFNFAKDNLDMMIVSAGNYSDDSLHSLSYEESSEMLRVNILGTVNCLEVARKAIHGNHSNGNIVIITSVSSLLNYKNATIYSKTKRAINQVCDAYRKALQPFGIRVTVIAPGYVDTQRLRELNSGDLSKKPFVISCDNAATIIREGIENGEEFIIFPKKMKVMMLLLSYLPSFLQSAIMYKKAKWSNQKLNSKNN